MSWTCTVGWGEGAGGGWVEAAGRQWALRHKEEGWEGGLGEAGRELLEDSVCRGTALCCSPAALCCHPAGLCSLQRSAVVLQPFALTCPLSPHPVSCAAWLLVLASSQPGAWLQHPVSIAAGPGMARAVGVADKCERQCRHHNAMQERWVQAEELVWCWSIALQHCAVPGALCSTRCTVQLQVHEGEEVWQISVNVSSAGCRGESTGADKCAFQWQHQTAVQQY